MKERSDQGAVMPSLIFNQTAMTIWKSTQYEMWFENEGFKASYILLTTLKNR